MSKNNIELEKARKEQEDMTKEANAVEMRRKIQFLNYSAHTGAGLTSATQGISSGPVSPFRSWYLISSEF